MATKKLIICDYCHEKIELFHHRVTLYNPSFKPELKRQYYHGDCYTEKILKENDCKVDWQAQSIKEARIETIEKAKAMLDGMLKEVD